METGSPSRSRRSSTRSPGIDELRSTTKEGVSVITVQFVLEKNGDVAAQEVRDKITTILASLPEGTDPPIIDKFDLDAMPVLTIAVSGQRDFAKSPRSPQADQGRPGDASPASGR